MFARSDLYARLTAGPLFPAVAVAAALAGPARGSAGWSASWLVTGLEIALGVAVCAAGVLADRRVRPHGQATSWSDVQAVSRPGPPTSVTLHDAGTRPAVIVRVDRRVGVAAGPIGEDQAATGEDEP
jgi:hypothetical protein